MYQPRSVIAKKYVSYVYYVSLMFHCTFRDVEVFFIIRVQGRRRNVYVDISVTSQKKNEILRLTFISTCQFCAKKNSTYVHVYIYIDKTRFFPNTLVY